MNFSQDGVTGVEGISEPNSEIVTVISHCKAYTDPW